MNRPANCVLHLRVKSVEDVGATLKETLDRLPSYINKQRNVDITIEVRPRAKRFSAK